MICKVWRVNSEHPLKAIYWKNGLKYPSLGEWQTYANRLIQTELPINYVDDKTINVVLAYNDMIPYLMIQEPNNWSGGNSDRVNIKKYYIYNRTLEYSSNSRICEYTLDYYATYVLPMVNLQVSDSYYWFGDVNTLAIRSSNFNFEIAKLFEDPLIQDVKMIGDYQFVKSYFPKRNLSFEGNQYTQWTHNRYGLSCYTNTKHKMINGVCYAVFASGNNGAYEFIPILSEDDNPLFWLTENTISEYVVTYETSDTINHNTNLGDKLPTIISYRKWVDKNGNNVPWYQIQDKINECVNRNYTYRIFDSENLMLFEGKDGTVISTRKLQQYCTYVKGVNESDPWKPSANHWAIDLRLNGITKNVITVKFENQIPQASKLKIAIPQESLTNVGVSINNNLDNINNLKFSREYSNKFVGYFFLPHILYLGEYTKLKSLTYNTDNGRYTKTFLVVNLPIEGVKLESKILSKVGLTPNSDNGGMTLPSISQYIPSQLPPYYYKYLKARYYNNDIDLSLFYDKLRNSFISNPHFLFSGSGMMVEKVAGVPINKCTWTLPYQLPSGSDNYINYVNSTYNTANTGVAIAKQNMIYSGITGLLGAIGLGASSGLTGLLAAGFSKPLAGLTGGAIGANKLFGTGGNILSGTQSIQKIKAQYADAKNTYGTEITQSNIQDTAWMTYLFSEKEQFEGIELFVPSVETINQMTQTWMRYGFYCPTYRSLRSVIDSRKGGYIQFDANSTELALGNWMTTAPWWYTEEVISYIYNLMTEGFWVNEWN